MIAEGVVLYALFGDINDCFYFEKIVSRVVERRAYFDEIYQSKLTNREVENIAKQLATNCNIFVIRSFKRDTNSNHIISFVKIL